MLAFGSLFAIPRPPGRVPIFLAVTEGDGRHERIAMARRACIIAFAVMTAFALLGSRILASFQVSMPALQIAGGLVILRVGLEMLGGWRRRLTTEEREEALQKNDVAATPLAVFMLRGPGSITVAIVLGSQADGFAQYAALVGITAFI